MAIDDQTLRKQLRFRSWHRGTREMDLILGRFADRHLGGMDRRQLEGYARLLEESDPDIYGWLADGETRPVALEADVWALLRRSLAAPTERGRGP